MAVLNLGLVPKLLWSRSGKEKGPWGRDWKVLPRSFLLNSLMLRFCHIVKNEPHTSTEG